MKTITINKSKILTVLAAIVIISLNSCTTEDQIGESQLDYTEPKRSELDQWIKKNYLDPYNIDVQYKWNQNSVDNNNFLFPPTVNKVKPALEIIKKIWIDTFNKVAGEEFLKKIAPKEIVLVGGENLNLSGTKTLGLAEGGRRITMFETDLLNKKDSENVWNYMHTIEHEYIHILNQTKPFDEKAWAVISPEGYAVEWYLFSLQNSLQDGFISSYARANVKEDFAEMASILLLLDKKIYETIITRLSEANSPAAQRLRNKENIVVQYFRSSFNIDFYELREQTQKSLKEVNQS